MQITDHLSRWFVERQHCPMPYYKRTEPYQGCELLHNLTVISFARRIYGTFIRVAELLMTEPQRSVPE